MVVAMLTTKPSHEPKPGLGSKVSFDDVSPAIATVSQGPAATPCGKSPPRPPT